MSKIQEIFIRIQETKKEQKKIRDMYKDALVNSQEYQEVTEELKNLKEKKKKIENSIKQDFVKEFEKMDTLKSDMENDYQLLSDLAINKVTKGEAIEVSDENKTKYEPIFSVKFKKVN